MIELGYCTGKHLAEPLGFLDWLWLLEPTSLAAFFSRFSHLWKEE